jgi:hypothetical protein
MVPQQKASFSNPAGKEASDFQRSDDRTIWLVYPTASNQESQLRAQKAGKRNKSHTVDDVGFGFSML